MRPMLTRRTFLSMTAASLAAQTLLAQQLPAAGQANVQFSEMMWTLKQQGIFEEDLERVAQAGSSHVDLTGEFKQWSDDDWRRILARMRALNISVDTTSGAT